MDEYRTLQSNETKNQKELETQLQEATIEREEAESKYQQNHEKILFLEQLLISYKNEIEKKPNDYNKAIKTSINIIAFLGYTISLVVITKIASILLLSSVFWLIPVAITSILTIILEQNGFNKLENKVNKKVKNIIMNSEEYQKLLIHTRSVEEDLVVAKKEEIKNKINMRNAITKYSGTTSAIKIKHAVSTYNKSTAEVNGHSKIKKLIKK